MRAKVVLCLLIVVAFASYAGTLPKTLTKVDPAKLVAAGDTMYVPGGTLLGGENAGSLETAINGDTLANGARVNPNRVYALNQGEYYFQLAPIYCYDPTGTLTIAGIPSTSGTTKPVILISPPSGTNEGTNVVYGSIKCDGIHYQWMQTNGWLGNSELFYCGTANSLPQSLTINNCLFEFSNIDIFDCTNETGAIGGWPNGAKFKITNSYFRNMFYGGQWWGSRVFQCKHPIDTLWVENCTVTTGGLTFLQQNQLTDFMYINHNTIVNNKKYWLLSPYHKSMFVTNNIFINQNWVGEDTNVTNSGQDPDKYFMSTINVDTNNATNGLIAQPKYTIDATHFTADLDLNKEQVYISDNINYYDPLLINGYYNSSKYKEGSINALPSYLTWFGFPGAPFVVGNVPGIWMNSRTQAFFAAYGPGNGGFIEKRTSTADPGTVTLGIADASVVDSMAVWNANQWGDPRFPNTSALTSTKYIYGDFDPLTIPGFKTEDGAGIVKFTDLNENFSQSTHLSEIDQLPIGALIWDDAKLANYNSANAWAAVYAKYIAEGGLTSVPGNPSDTPQRYSLAQNYPNPFNPSTTIRYSLPRAGSVELAVYNMLGQKIRTLVTGNLPAGDHVATWDGKDRSGNSVSSGVYFYQLKSGSFVASHKMVLLK
jgi:hypothetical protein